MDVLNDRDSSNQFLIAFLFTTNHYENPPQGVLCDFKRGSAMIENSMQQKSNKLIYMVSYVLSHYHYSQ